MKIIIRADLCNGCEKCVNTCFEVFHVWGMYLRSSFEVPNDTPHRDRIGKAVLACPKKAIRVVETPENESGGADALRTVVPHRLFEVAGQEGKKGQG